MKWTKLKIHVNPMAVEALSDSLLGLGVEGIEIEDNFLSEQDRKSMFIDYTDEDLIPLEEYRVVAYLDETMDINSLKESVRAELSRIGQFLEIGSGAFSVEEMPDEDYENKWKDYYQPFKVGEHMVITPIWEEPEISADDVLIRIDPGMAFGSGTHETTSLCVEFLQENEVKGKKVLDVGCGSGILGIVASKLDAESVLAIDIDENAVTIAEQNAVSNNVQSVMSVTHGDLLDMVEAPVQIVVANILADVIMAIAEDVKQVLTDEGLFISSGILVTRADEVEAVLKDNGFQVLEVRKRGEWSAILAKKLPS